MALTVNRWGRRLFTACLIIPWLGEASLLAGGRGPAIAATAIFLAAAAFFSSGRRQAPAGLAMLLMLGAITFVQERQWPGPAGIRPTNYLAPAALAAFLVPFLLLKGRSEADKERAGWQAACGVVAAGFFLAALAKLRAAGLGWGRGQSLALLLAERSYEGPALLRALRRLLAAHPDLCGAFGTGALLTESLAPLYLFPGLRVAFSAAATALMLAIFACMGYFELSWAALAWSLALASRSPGDEASRRA